MEKCKELVKKNIKNWSKNTKGERFKVYYKEKYKDQSDLDKPGKNPISLKILSLFYIWKFNCIPRCTNKLSSLLYILIHQA